MVITPPPFFTYAHTRVLAWLCGCDVQGEGKLLKHQRKHPEELRAVIAITRHGDRTPKQKMKMKISFPEFLAFYNKYSPGLCGCRGFCWLSARGAVADAGMFALCTHEADRWFCLLCSQSVSQVGDGLCRGTARVHPVRYVEGWGRARYVERSRFFIGTRALSLFLSPSPLENVYTVRPSGMNLAVETFQPHAFRDVSKR